MLDQVIGTLYGSGLHVVTEAHGVAQDGANYFGLLQVTDGDSTASWCSGRVSSGSIEAHAARSVVLGLHPQSFDADLAVIGLGLCRRNKQSPSKYPRRPPAWLPMRWDWDHD
jgi:hypothetical protein